MRNLNAADMLNVWEQGLSRSLLERALILLAVARPEVEPEALAGLSIGQRDRRLMQLRQHLFGSRLVSSAICPACSERIEWENSIADLLVPSLPDKSRATEFDLQMDNYQLHFRLPNSLDMAAVIEGADAEQAQGKLLQRCILKVECGGKTCAVDQLPDSIIDELARRIEALDPQAEIRITLHCPACSHSWDAWFDIASFLWAELNDWAERTLQMIHKLARGYGWTEQEILRLSPIRRQLYLGMLGS